MLPLEQPASPGRDMPWKAMLGKLFNPLPRLVSPGSDMFWGARLGTLFPLFHDLHSLG